MKQLVMLAMALAGLSALLSSCGGGGEEEGVLAMAFRLDGESPVLCAYVGNSAEDAWALPAGPYYIEVVDQDDEVISLGAVDIAAGDTVDFPPSLEAAGGVADPERSEPLKTVANFLVDVELAEYAFLEVATGGFDLPPFDPAVEPTAADVQGLFEMYAGIAAQEEALRAALSQIEAGATVSSGVRYVRSQWGPPLGPWDFFKKKVNDALFGGDGLLSWMKRATGEGQRERILAIAEQIPEGDRDRIFAETPVGLTGDAHDFDSWMEEVRQGKLDGELAAIYGQLYSADPEAARNAGQRPIDVLAQEGAEGANKGVDFEAEAYRKVPGVGKALELGDKLKEWAEYAQKLAEFPPGAIEETARSRYEQAIAEKIKEDLKKRAADLPSLTDKAIDKLADYFAKKVVAAVPKLAPTPAPTVAGLTPTATSPATPIFTATPVFTPVHTATPAEPVTSPTTEVTATPAADTSWIEGYVQSIANQWLDKGYSGVDVAVYADDLRQCLTQAVQAGASPEEAKAGCPPEFFEPSITPEPTQAPTPEPEPTEAPTPEPTPTPEGEDITAVGQFLVAPVQETVVGNTVTLKFNTTGGDVTLDGRLDTRGLEAEYCDPYSHSLTLDCDGTYSPESGTFGGTCQTQSATTYYTAEFTGPDEWECKANQSGASGSAPWQATLEGTVVKGSYGDLQFELTVRRP